MEPLPQLLLLYVVYRMGEATFPELSQVMYMLKIKGVNVNYSFVKLCDVAVSKDLQLDINLLKVLGLVRELDGGKVSITEKGKLVVNKLRKNKQYIKLLAFVDEVIDEIRSRSPVHAQL